MAHSSGISYIITFNGQTLAYSKTGSLDRALDAIDTTTKNSAGKKEFIPGDSSWQLSDEGLVNTSDAAIPVLRAALDNRTIVTVRFPGHDGIGYWSGSGFLTSFNITNPENDANAYSIGVQGTGALTWNAS